VRYLYILIIYLMLPVILVRLFVRGLKNPAYLRRTGERFGRYSEPSERFDIWIHAVSVGEVNAAGPLAKTLAQKYPHKRVLVTTMTPTGADQARVAMGPNVHHLYLPYDYPGAVRRFLNHTRPALAIMMETEIWPNFITHCRRRKIPLFIANLRLSARSYKSYATLKPFSRSIFKKVTGYIVQTAADGTRVAALLGKQPDNVYIAGNIKFEVNLPASLKEVAEVIRREWGTDRTIWVVGSTHEKEEELILKSYQSLKVKHPELLLVLVPRHPERFDNVSRLIRRSQLNFVRRSKHNGMLPGNIDVFLGDTMGELPVFYAAGDIAFVGGSLVPIGGHNILEPCALGKPVIFGPHMHNFEEISQIAIQRQAGIKVKDEVELISVIHQLINNSEYRYQCGENGLQMIRDNQGSLNRSLEILEPYLNNA
jgi:3-deoxy-D-manno-octulosonic-acid transferase